MTTKFIAVQTGRKEFRVFEKRGAWWGLIHTYQSRARAAFAVDRLQRGVERSPFAGARHSPVIDMLPQAAAALLTSRPAVP